MASDNCKAATVSYISTRLLRAARFALLKLDLLPSAGAESEPSYVDQSLWHYPSGRLGSPHHALERAILQGISVTKVVIADLYT